MTRSLKVAGFWLAVPLVAAVLVACGSKGAESTSSGEESGDIKAGPGVTATTIKLGALTDLSGVFAPLAEPLTQANQLYWKQRNAEGGVCGRKVELEIKDHGYDPQKAVVQYRDFSADILGLQQLLGSPITAALLPTLGEDSMIALLSAWPSSLLSNENIIIVGTTYDVEMINGLDYFKRKGMIKSGDTIGHLYFEGEYGENGLKGTKYFASENDMKVVEQKIKATDEDMSGQVAAFKRAGVKAIAVTTAPTQLASVAGIAAAQGMNVPIIGNNPTYDPALLKSPAAEAVKAHAYISGSIAPWTLDEPEVQKVSQEFKAAYPKSVPKASVQFGWAQAEVMFQILNKACENKDLSRDGLIKAAHELSDIDTGGLIAGPLDYTQAGQPATRAVYIVRPADVPGGLKALPGTFESETAKSYDVAAE
jgi:ABC-type branched-subunit amino acid transport system substrate-binding protein